MSNYRRLISYIYAYEGGIKGKNVGFAKLEVRNGQCKIQVNVRNVYIGSQDTGVYLLSGSEEILVGRIFIRNGAGEFRAIVSVGNVAGSGHTIDQCYGLTVHNLSDSWQSYTTIWEDAVAHAAEVVLEEATSERVKKEEPDKSLVAEAVEAEIEAQSRQEEEAHGRQQEDMQEEELPASVVPPAEPEEILRPADMGVMEIRPMEVLPIGKELTAADFNRESEAENAGTSQGEPEIMPEMCAAPEEKPEPDKKEPESPEEPGQAEAYELWQESKTMQPQPGIVGNEPADREESLAPLQPQQTAALNHMPQQQNGAMTEPVRQAGQQSGQPSRLQENTPPQPSRQNQWGQSGMLFPPNWFGRPTRQNRPIQQSSQPLSGRTGQGMRTGQPGGQAPIYDRPGLSGQTKPDNQGSESELRIPVSQPHLENQGEHLTADNQAALSPESCVTESAAASEPMTEGTKPQEAVLQSAQQPASGQPDSQRASQPAGTVLPEQHIPDDEPGIDSVWQRFYKTYPKIQAFDYNGGCEIITIKPQDIGLLPRETWGYGNNSFLLHGYYNHRYLIFARLNNPKGRPRFLLGVPGHYYSNEKYMAAMFGFPNFVLSKVQPSGEDRFGYWYTDIRLGS